MDATDYLKLVLDPDRLRVLGLVAIEPSTADEVAKRLELRRRDVLEALAAFRQLGVVEVADGHYHLVPQALRELALDLPQPQPPSDAVYFGMTREEGEVLGRFFRGKRLTEIPTSRSKRLVVLERIALEFEPGEHYDERAVNRVLERFHPDYASLRRYLVDEGFLDRAEGEYWRSGGRIG